MSRPVARRMAPPSAVVRDPTGKRWLCFDRPLSVVAARRVDEVRPALDQLATRVEAHGLHAAGFIAYEAAPAFDPSLTVRPAADAFPLLWFGLYEAPRAEASLPPASGSALAAVDWLPTVAEDEYRRQVARIREYIRSGDTYQVNYSYRLRAALDATDPWAAFLGLVEAHDPPYAAFVDTGEQAIVSTSPELFFRLDGNLIESRPMKGTAARGLWFEHDVQQAARLAASTKDRAENVMIVDMVRNDLGRIAETGSVHVPSLFDVDRYPTVWQMTSTVRAETRASLVDILRALFPAASITGAPKRRTMEIIAELESTPRHIYTGAIGVVAPARRAQFNVAIRTLRVDRRHGRAEYGVGGGIVWDSDPQREEQECRVKARVLAAPPVAFDLLETLRWTPEQGYWLLAEHLERLRKSALYFAFRADPARIRQELERVAAGLPAAPHRVRLLLSRKGGVSVQASAADPGAVRFPDIRLARLPVDASDPFLYHKTTNRRVYEAAVAQSPGAADVLLFNARGEITESTIANVAVKRNGELETPPLRCGLLPGTLRARLLAQRKLRERTITVEDLLSAGRQTFLLNSVRGMRPVRVTPPAP